MKTREMLKNLSLHELENRYKSWCHLLNTQSFMTASPQACCHVLDYILKIQIELKERADATIS
jgi:hypothetical protein